MREKHRPLGAWANQLSHARGRQRLLIRLYEAGRKAQRTPSCAASFAGLRGRCRHKLATRLSARSDRPVNSFKGQDLAAEFGKVGRRQVTDKV
jgi:hypothetical protein